MILSENRYPLFRIMLLRPAGATAGAISSGPERAACLRRRPRRRRGALCGGPRRDPLLERLRFVVARPRLLGRHAAIDRLPAPAAIVWNDSRHRLAARPHAVHAPQPPADPRCVECSG